MKLLLDTHLLLWSAAHTAKLSTAARVLLADKSNELLFSVVSLWEIAIKRGLERDDFKVDAGILRRGLLDHGYSELAMTGAHVLAVGALPPIHRDPFDRMLIAQALTEEITLATADAKMAGYPGSIRLV